MSDQFTVTPIQTFSAPTGSLHAGDHPIRTNGLPLAAGLTLERGTLIYLPDGETDYVMYDGEAIAAGSLLGILLKDEDTTSGAKSVAAYISGDFDRAHMTAAPGVDLTDAALVARMADQMMYTRTSAF